MGGHVDSTQRKRASALTGRAVTVIRRIIAVCALPLDFRKNFAFCAFCFGMLLYTVLKSLVSQSSLTKHRSAFGAAVWSRRRDLANLCAILCLLVGRAGGDPGFHASWSRFGLLTSLV